MMIATGMIILLLVLMLGVVVGGIALQIFLSRRESKWPGLILPIISGLYSLLMVLGLMAYDNTWETIATVLMTLLVSNIPTLVLLAIYWGCREKRRVKEQMDKMQIDDL